MRRLIAHLTGVLLLLLPIVAQSLESPTPEEVGLSRERLARIAPALSRQIEARSFPGAVAIVARKGRIAYRSEERRVGKEGGARGWRCASRKKDEMRGVARVGVV